MQSIAPIALGKQALAENLRFIVLQYGMARSRLAQSSLVWSVPVWAQVGHGSWPYVWHDSKRLALGNLKQLTSQWLP